MRALVHAALLLAQAFPVTATRESAPVCAPDTTGSAVASARSPSEARVAAADSWVASDKFQHFWASYAATTFAFAAARSAGVERRGALWLGVAASAAAGAGKEAVDQRRGRGVSARDLVADALGTAAAFFLLREVR